MADKLNLLNLTSVPITPNLSLRIPTVGEVLANEQAYYSLTFFLTASPFSMMVQLDDKGIDYTTITEYELFVDNFGQYIYQMKPFDKTINKLQNKLNSIQNTSSDEYKRCQDELAKVVGMRRLMWHQLGLGLVFENIDFGDLEIYKGRDKKDLAICNTTSNTIIDEAVYTDLADTIRQINMYAHVKSKPGNESAKRYLLEKERKRLKRNARKPYKSYLENMVVALVNNSDFPYNYDECMDLSIYRFNQSLRQIQHKTTFDKTMIGVYAGTINTSKLTNKECLSWIQTKQDL